MGAFGKLTEGIGTQQNAPKGACQLLLSISGGANLWASEPGAPHSCALKTQARTKTLVPLCPLHHCNLELCAPQSIQVNADAPR